jgi:pimeloyl-ACP methyl ester carboxylesterase
MASSIFIHGLESSNQGTKAVFFKKRYPDMLIPHFTGSLAERMEKLRHILAGRSNLRIVGSSFGGLMASLFAMENTPRVDKLVLLAPALNLLEFSPGTDQEVQSPVWLYHGRNDEVIPLSGVEHIAGKIFLNLTFHVVDDDHYLHKTFKSIDWPSLLC